MGYEVTCMPGIVAVRATKHVLIKRSMPMLSAAGRTLLDGFDASTIVGLRDRALIEITLKKPWAFDDLIPAPKKPRRLPVVLSPDEVVCFLESIQPPELCSANTTSVPDCAASAFSLAEQ